MPSKLALKVIFKRTIDAQLDKWKDNPDRKPLIIRGARQVGKTRSIGHFASKFKNRILLNLEKSGHRSYFEDYVRFEDLLEALFIQYNIENAREGPTLLFIDEIQESPQAIFWLRYFYEDAPYLYVIAAGSLLEFALSKVESLPVGRVEYLYMHPMNFREYLEALGNQRLLRSLDKIPVSKVAHKALMGHFHRYVILGGMPEIIAVFLKSGNLAELPRIYEGIWTTYKSDVIKYARNETERNVISHILNTAPNAIDSRIKFQNFGNSNYRSREVGEGFRNLDNARIIRIIYPTTETKFPLKRDFKKYPRIQLLDTGLVNYSLGLFPELLKLEDLSEAYRGAIIPHIIFQELISLGQIKDELPYFWVREKTQSSAEVDLVMTFNGEIIPIEIKSGATGSLKSLHQFINTTHCKIAFRIYGGEFKIEDTLTPAGNKYTLYNIPYYLGTKLYDYIEYALNA